MRIRRAVVAAACVVLSAAAEVGAADLQCGTSPETDRRLAAFHARPRERARVAAHAAARPALHNGAIYLPANEEVAPGYRPFDLEGQSLVFRPRDGNVYTVARGPLRYVEPASKGQLLGTWITADLGFTFSAFGRSVQRVYLSQSFGITFEEPRPDTAIGFGALETVLRTQPLIAPLMQTSRSQRSLPTVYVDRTPSSLVVTWRNTTHQSFGYDVQAELHADGSIVFSYKSLRNMRWGTPVITGGTAAGALPRTSLFAADIPRGTTATTPPDAALRDMLDMTRVEVSRITGSDIFSVKLTLAGSIDASKVPAAQSLRYHFIVGTEMASINVSRTEVTVEAFNSYQPAAGDVTGRVEGNTVEIFGLQAAPGTRRTERLNVVTFLRPTSRPVDVALYDLTFDPAPGRLGHDLSAVGDGADLSLPIFEPFLLPVFDPYAVWEQVKNEYALRDDGIDAVAMYQTFFTELILFATAYAAVGNAQVDGIHPPDPDRGTTLPRMPTLMHMNQLNFDENADERMSSVVALHEFGHRWLYTLEFTDGATKTNVLSPQRYHPAAYVDTRSAFPLYGAEESSVMGGGHFTNIGGNRYRARAQQYGFSWTDLYLMGLAAPEEVPSWFYLAGTDPELPKAYFPTDKIEVTGTKNVVSLDQVIAAQGARNPSPAISQRTFRVLFVLVTDPGKEASPDEIAKIDWLRAKMERDFATATGGRGRLITTLTPPNRSKRRSVR